ncbi:MAG: diaminopimelate epimerase [bacterium]|jgi:diaminopimelate epimerase
MRFLKYHALGNDYLVIDPRTAEGPLSPHQIQQICHPHFGVGSDGILWGSPEAEAGTFSLRILNPDGSEAEKSGNGLRIFSRFLWDEGAVAEAPFYIQTPGGRVEAVVRPDGREVTVEMGQVSFSSERIPVSGPAREVLEETIEVAEETLRYCAATIGNPHCVVLQKASEADARRWGPLLERAERFPNRTNVQFLEVLSRDRIRIQIWERGAGYTLASGSSSSAAAAVAHRMGWCDSEIGVEMPGGVLFISILPDFHIRMRGPVTRIAEGKLSSEIWKS